MWLGRGVLRLRSKFALGHTTIRPEAISNVTGADLAGVTRVTSQPPWRGSLFHVIIMRATEVMPTP